MKNKFKKRIAIFSATISLFSFLTPLNVAKSNEIDTVTRHFSYAVAEDPSNPGQMNLYKVSAAGAASLIEENLFPDGGPGTFSASDMAVDNVLGKIYFREPPRGGGVPLRARVFDVKTETVTGWKELTGFASGAQPIFVGMPDITSEKISKKCTSTNGTTCDSGTSKIITLGGSGSDEIAKIDDSSVSVGGATLAKKNSDGSVQIGADGNDIDVVEDGLNIDGAAVITKNADGSVQIGADGNDVDITAEGISVGGDPLVSRKGNGELHIGKNSWITKEENGRQKVYAKDAAGNPIPIDYTNGTKLLINGRDVEQSINNVGALSAALTGLPSVPTDTTLACGFGTGTHGGDFAFASGCASKVNEKLSINYAASMIMPGQEYAGDFEDTFSARAGFVWKLGKPVKPTLISLKEKKEFETQINTLEETNKQLLARLEKLEKVALGSIQSKDLASNQIDFKSLNRNLKKNKF